MENEGLYMNKLFEFKAGVTVSLYYYITIIRLTVITPAPSLMDIMFNLTAAIRTSIVLQILFALITTTITAE